MGGLLGGAGGRGLALGRLGGAGGLGGVLRERGRLGGVGGRLAAIRLSEGEKKDKVLRVSNRTKISLLCLLQLRVS